MMFDIFSFQRPYALESVRSAAVTRLYDTASGW